VVGFIYIGLCGSWCMVLWWGYLYCVVWLLVCGKVLVSSVLRCVILVCGIVLRVNCIVLFACWCVVLCWGSSVLC